MLIDDWKIILKKIDSIDLTEIELDEKSYNKDFDDYVETDFHQINRKGYLVTLMILFEDEIKRICDLLYDIESLKLKQSELKGNNLERFRIYITRVANLDTGINENEFETIHAITEVRNCIVHSNSLLQQFKGANSIIKLSKTLDGISINDDLLEITLEFCLKCADIISTFIDKVYDAALKRYPE
jgi:hypothetical protein